MLLGAEVAVATTGAGAKREAVVESAVDERAEKAAVTSASEKGHTNATKRELHRVSSGTFCVALLVCSPLVLHFVPLLCLP